MNKRIEVDGHLRLFAGNLESAISKYERVPKGKLAEYQKVEVEKLVSLETDFRHVLVKHPWGPAVYRDFVRHICDVNRNILAARPFFRERQAVFTKEISRALKDRQATGLYQYHANYQFVRWVMASRNWTGTRKGSKVVALARRIDETRTQLIEMNMPLAISRARIFWSRTPSSQLTYMDLIQIAVEGLMSGIDKFVLPYSQAYRHVLIGRMIGNLIEQYSETMVHFYPREKRKIYRANKAMSKGPMDFETISAKVNDGADLAHQTTPEEIQNLVAAASMLSGDASLPHADGVADEELTILTRAQADESVRPDVRAEEAEVMSVMVDAISKLPLLSRKILQLRGVDL